MAQKHPIGTYECKQEARIMKIETGVEEICDKVDDLIHKFDDALFPSDMHPDNGLIQGQHRLKNDVKTINEKIQKYEDANIITDLVTVKGEITKAKVWVSAVVAIAVFLFTVIDIVIKLFIK